MVVLAQFTPSDFITYSDLKKGQCHEIFDPRDFLKESPTGPWFTGWSRENRFENRQNLIPRCQGHVTVCWKNRGSKISWHCPLTVFMLLRNKQMFLYWDTNNKIQPKFVITYRCFVKGLKSRLLFYITSIISRAAFLANFLSLTILVLFLQLVTLLL
jgi:hypothetical protein